MKTKKTVSRITAFLHRSVSKAVLDALREKGIDDLYVAAARSLVIEVKKGILSLLPGRNLTCDPQDMVLFLVEKNLEEPFLKLIANKGRLTLPGMGSVLAEDVDLLSGHPLCRGNDAGPFDADAPPLHAHPLTGICCIVQRGRGETVDRIALDTGTCVPSLSFGIGTGIRDKMGLLRITIPSEKEIIHVFAPAFEADGILEMMAEAGSLDQPGKGFIYTFPVRGLINMKVARGGQQHAASIEQIVAVVDHMRGGAEWRRRTGVSGEPRGSLQKCLARLVDLILLCNGGTGSELVKAAMSAGAGGATIATWRHFPPSDSPLRKISPLREACSIVIPEDRTEAVADALESAGAFTDHCHGQIHLRRAPKALTYLGK